MHAPLIMLAGSYDRAKMGDLPALNLDWNPDQITSGAAPATGTTTATQRGNVVTNLISQGLEVALSWLDLEKSKTTSTTERARIDAEITGLQQGKTPQQVYGMQYIPWIAGGAALLVAIVLLSKKRRR